MNVLIHIPARAGSKRLPGKNLRTVGGVSLVAHAAAMGRKFATGIGGNATVVVDTESAEIANAALNAGAHAWLMRPESFAQDDSTSEDTVLSACDRLGFSGAIVLLQPTSPLRTLHDLVPCWAAFNTGAQSVVSVTDGTAEANGAVYICTSSWLRKRNGFFSRYGSLMVPMPAKRSIDINTLEDLERAEQLWQEQHASSRA